MIIFVGLSVHCMHKTAIYLTSGGGKYYIHDTWIDINKINKISWRPLDPLLTLKKITIQTKNHKEEEKNT